MQYSNFIMKNNVHATLSTALSSIATTIQLTTGQWARFWTEFPQIATLESFDWDWKVVKREIVQITARNDDDLTVVRAFAPCPANDDANSQSQSSVSFSADDQISLYIPKEIFDKIAKSLNDIYDNWTNKLRTELVSWLQVEVNPWSVLVWSAYYDFAGWTITLTDNATNYLEIDEDWNIANNTSGRNDENAKLAIITTAGGSVTNIQDWRLWTVGWKIGGVNIHDLTEKTILSPNDEFIIADSENIFNNKKVKLSNILPASIVRSVTLGEAVTAWDWKGACYFWTDWKVYLSNVAWHNYCDWIVIDSWNAGDTVRMIISWFVPCTLNWTSQTVNLAYTSWTTDTWYGDFVSVSWATQTSYSWTPGLRIAIDNTNAWFVPVWRINFSGATSFIQKLYWIQWTITATQQWLWSWVVITNHYVTWQWWNYWNDINYSVSWCELWKVVPWWFIFNPRPVEYLVWLWSWLVSSWGTLWPIQSKFDWIKTIVFGDAAVAENATWLWVYESHDNSNWNMKLILVQWSTTTGNATILQWSFTVKKWYYYKVLYATSWQTAIWILDNE